MVSPFELSEGFSDVAVIVAVDVTEADRPPVEAVIEPSEASVLDPVSAAVPSVVAPERLSSGGRSDNISSRSVSSSTLLQLTNSLSRGRIRSDRTIWRWVPIVVPDVRVVSLLSIASADVLGVVRNLKGKARLTMDGTGGDSTEQSHKHQCRHDADTKSFCPHGEEMSD